MPTGARITVPDGESFFDAIDEVVGTGWTILASPQRLPEWRRRAVPSAPHRIIRSRFAEARRRELLGERAPYEIPLSIPSYPPPASDSASQRAKEVVEASERFAESPLFRDLGAGAAVVRAERCGEKGDWAAAVPVDMLPGFWQHGRFEIVRASGTISEAVRGARVDFANLVLFQNVEGAPGATEREAADKRPEKRRVERGNPSTNSGMPGRPTANHFYLEELKRRHAAGEMCAKVGAEAQALLRWFRAAHPGLNAGTARTIENNIRARHRALKAQRTKIDP